MIWVLFFSFLLFILEFVFLHILQYTTDYLQALLVIGYALMGIGLGGLASALVQCTLEGALKGCLLGSWLFLLLSLIKVLCWPLMDLTNLILVSLFACPGFYLAKMFTAYDSRKVYVFDMLGAGMGVLFLVLAYQYFSSEHIILFIFLILSLVGLLGVTGGGFSDKIWKLTFIFLMGVSIYLLGHHARTGGLDLFKLARPVEKFTAYKDFSGGHDLIKSYDNFVARVEVLRAKGDSKRKYMVSFWGYRNDVIFSNSLGDPQGDRRLVWGMVENPRIFIMGTSAQGLVKLSKSITSQDRIHGVEINPAIYRIMTRDFFKESGKAYEGINIKVGNAITQLNKDPSYYDIITMMNVHSSPRVFMLGPPDFIHTKEFYTTAMQHLTPEGALNIEERPLGQIGEYAGYRLISTLYTALKEMGASSPKEHFFIYSYKDSYRYTNAIPSDGFLIIYVKKTPFSSEDHVKLERFLKKWKNPVRVHYLYGVYSNRQYQRLFDSLDSNKLQKNYPGWDLSVLTTDKPYPSQVDQRYMPLQEALVRAGVLTAFLLVMISWFSFKGVKNRGLNTRLLFFQMAVGLAYIMVEILFMNIYQKEFISPSTAFIATLSPLLVSSAWGGQVLTKTRNSWRIVLLLAASLGLHWLFIFPGAHLFPLWVRIMTVITLMIASGFLMGYFFPLGLIIAREKGLAQNVSHYFALNCISGAFAVVLSFYLSIRLGFSMTLGLAALLYLAATVLLIPFFRDKNR